MSKPIEPTVIIPPQSGGAGAPPPPPASPQSPPLPGVEGLVIVEKTLVNETVIIMDDPTPRPVEDPGGELPGWLRSWGARRRDKINPRYRFVFFNLSAGAVGYSLMGALSPHGGAGLLASLQMAPVPAGVTAVTVLAAAAGWQAGKFFRGIGGCLGLLASPIGAACLGMWGQGSAPVVAPLYAEWAPWPGLLTPAALAVGAGVGCWWLFDRRARAGNWALTGRWLARIPLATVALSAVLYPSLLTTGVLS